MITQFQIYEGLINSVNINKMENILKKYFPEYDIGLSAGGIKIYDPIYAEFEYDRDIKKLEEIKGIDINKIKNFIEPLGWFVSSAVTLKNTKLSDLPKLTHSLIKKEIDDKINIVYIEQKFGDKFEGKISKLYHITDRKFLPKIKEKGLIPRYMGKRTIHPERIYLCDSDGLRSLYCQFKEILENPVVLEINMIGLNVPLYYDNNFYEGGYYTIENIPPKNIKFQSEQYQPVSPEVATS
jgi:hypothetical protein